MVSKRFDSLTKTLSQIVQELDQRVIERTEALGARLEQLQGRMNNEMEEIRNIFCTLQQAPTIPTPPPPIPPPINLNPPPPPHHYSARISKVEFPCFDGKNVRDWLYKCDQFFLLDDTPDSSKVRLASIHLEGLAL